MLIRLTTLNNYPETSKVVFKPGNRAEPYYYRDTVEQAQYMHDTLGVSVGADADATNLNYDIVRTINGRSKIGTIRAWVNIWDMVK